jgi:hypothetical protein
MQKSPLLATSGFLIAVGSCIALAGGLVIALFTWIQYFVPGHMGSVSGIDEPFYVQVAIIIFEISAFVLARFSSSNTWNGKKFSLSTFGATFLLVAGLLFFANLILNVIPHVAPLYIFAPFLQLYCGLPIIILASISIILIVSKNKEFNSKDINPLVALEAILILCSIISASFAFFSIVSLERMGIQFASNYALSTLIVSVCSFFSTALAGVLLLTKKNIYVIIALTVLSLLSALSLSFIFMFIYPWIGTFFKGLVTGSPIVMLSATALVLEFLAAKKRKLLPRA